MCTILGYGLPERETYGMLLFVQLLHSCLLTKWKKCNILSLFLQIHIVESTIPRRSSVPLSLQKGATYGMLPICKAFVCLPFYKRSFHIPLQSSWGARPLSVSSSSILSFIQTYSILLSTICCADGPPFSPERETFCVLSFSATFPFYRKTFCILPLTAFLFFSEENNFFIKRREYPMPAIRLLRSQACFCL